MKTKYFISILLCFILSFSFGQNRDTTELKKQVATYLVRDTHRVNVILDYFYFYVEHQNKHSKIDPLLLEALSISREKKYDLGTGRVLTILAPKYYHNSQKKKALKLTLESIQILKRLEASEDLLIAYTNLSELYMNNDDFRKALEVNLASVRVIEKEEPDLTHGRIYFYTAKTFALLEEYENAEKYYLKAKRNAESFDFPIGVATSNSALGQVYTKQGEYKKALPFIQSAIGFAKKNDQLPNLASSQKRLGDLFIKLKKYDLAAIEYGESIRIYKSIQNSNMLSDLYTNRSNAHELSGKTSLALDDLKKARFISDSLNSIEKLTLREDLMAKYETEKIKKESKIAKGKEALANLKAKQSRYFSIGIGVFSLITLLLIVILFNRLKVIRIQKKKLNESLALLQEKTAEELTNSRLVALKSQMNPHFIFNALNSIQDLILEKDTETSYDYIVLFSELMRSTLHYSGNEFIEIENEVTLLKAYLGLEQLRFGDELQYSIHQDVNSGFQIPTFIIQPFIENSIEHGLLHKNGSKELSIRFEKKEGLICSISDNGVGRAKSKEINDRRGGNHSSFALKNIEKRLSLLSEKYESNFSYEIIDLETDGICTGTQVILKLPYLDII